MLSLVSRFFDSNDPFRRAVLPLPHVIVFGRSSSRHRLNLSVLFKRHIHVLQTVRPSLKDKVAPCDFYSDQNHYSTLCLLLLCKSTGFITHLWWIRTYYIFIHQKFPLTSLNLSVFSTVFCDSLKFLCNTNSFDIVSDEVLAPPTVKHDVFL